MKSKIKQIIASIAILMVLTLSSTLCINLHTYIDNTNNKSSTDPNEDISTLSDSSKSLIYHEDFNDTSNFWDLYDVSKGTMSLSYFPSDDSYTSSEDPDMNYGSQSQCKVTNETGWVFSGESWMIGDQWTEPFDIVWDGSNWWVLDYNDPIVHKYTSSWFHTGDYYDLGSQDGHPRSISWDGTNWWMVGGDHIVYKYDASWDYTGISYDIGSEDEAPINIFWDGTNWWMVGEQTLLAHIYDSSWGYITAFFPDFEALGLYPRDIFWDGYDWWVLDESTSYIYLFDISWVYTGFSYNLESQDDNFGVSIILLIKRYKNLK